MSVKPLGKVGMIFVPEGKEKSFKLKHVKKKNNIKVDNSTQNLDVKDLLPNIL